MKKFLLAFLLLLSVSLIYSQSKILSMEDAMLKARTTLGAENLSQLQFYGSSNDYVYLKKMDAADVWVKGNLTTTESAFLSLSQLNTELRSSSIDTVKAMPAIRFLATGWQLTVSGNKILLDPV